MTRAENRKTKRFESIWAARLKRNPSRRPADLQPNMNQIVVEHVRVIRKRPNGVEYVDYEPRYKTTQK